MVRNIVGTLLDAQREADPIGAMAARSGRARDRRCAGATAPAAGLYLWRVEYPRGLWHPRALAERVPARRRARFG